MSILKQLLFKVKIMETVLKATYQKRFLLVFFTSPLKVMKILIKMDVILKGRDEEKEMLMKFMTTKVIQAFPIIFINL